MENTATNLNDAVKVSFKNNPFKAVGFVMGLTVLVINGLFVNKKNKNK